MECSSSWPLKSAPSSQGIAPWLPSVPSLLRSWPATSSVRPQAAPQPFLPPPTSGHAIPGEAYRFRSQGRGSVRTTLLRFEAAEDDALVIDEHEHVSVEPGADGAG